MIARGLQPGPNQWDTRPSAQGPEGEYSFSEIYDRQPPAAVVAHTDAEDGARVTRWAKPYPQNLKGFNPYNNSFWMPLHEYVEHPVVQELVHNNQVMQIAGISNYSKTDTGPQRRALLGDFAGILAASQSSNDVVSLLTRGSASMAVLQLAKDRLDLMPFVGGACHSPAPQS